MCSHSSRSTECGVGGTAAPGLNGRAAPLLYDSNASCLLVDDRDAANATPLARPTAILFLWRQLPLEASRPPNPYEAVRDALWEAQAEGSSGALPVTVLSGFLGAGKVWATARLEKPPSDLMTRACIYALVAV